MGHVIFDEALEHSGGTIDLKFGTIDYLFPGKVEDYRTIVAFPFRAPSL